MGVPVGSADLPVALVPVLFANFAEAMAEGRGKAQAETLCLARSETIAHLIVANGRCEGTTTQIILFPRQWRHCPLPNKPVPPHSWQFTTRRKSACSEGGKLPGSLTTTAPWLSINQRINFCSNAFRVARSSFAARASHQDSRQS